MPCVFSWPPLLVGNTVEEVVSSSATSSAEFALKSLYSIYARFPSKLFTVLLVVQRSVLV